MRLELFTVTLLFSYILMSSAMVYATSDLGMSKLDQVPPQPRSSHISQTYIICFHSVSVLAKYTLWTTVSVTTVCSSLCRWASATWGWQSLQCLQVNLTLSFRVSNPHRVKRYSPCKGLWTGCCFPRRRWCIDRLLSSWKPVVKTNYKSTQTVHTSAKTNQVSIRSPYPK